MVPVDPPAYRRYCGAALALGGLTLLGMSLLGLRIDGALAVVLVAVLIAAAIGTVAEDGRTAFSLVDLPVLLAMLVASPVVAPAIGGLLAAFDNRRFGRWVILGNTGVLVLAGAAAVGTFHGLSAIFGDPRTGAASWFLAAAAGAGAFFVVNHLLVAIMVALRYGEAPAGVWRRHLAHIAVADVIGSLVVVASIGLGAAVDEPTQRVVVGLVAVITVGLLLTWLEAIRSRDAERQSRSEVVKALRRAEHAEQRALDAERAAVVRADGMVNQLHEVATGTVLALMALVDLKDRYTARHSASVGRLCRAVAAELGWSPERQALAHVAGLVHDIGKMGVPDAVLRKPGRPTAEEWDVIKQHPDWGADALANVGFGAALTDGIRSHHERWDGSGYHGLSGDEIPLLGRLIAVCDTYDAMTARRPFRDARSHDDAVREIERESGRLFDPVMSAALLELVDAGIQIETAVPMQEFANEWRRACFGIDMSRLYVQDPLPLHGRVHAEGTTRPGDHADAPLYRS
ncbi:MAG: HD-GYP domain-containing protein [Thermoleophilia bacterium]|nr:HD-GYP domain-containing protein [Thermoleophilia bacterium]